MSHLQSVLSKHVPDTHKPPQIHQPTKPHTPPPQKSRSSPTRTTSSPHTIHHSIYPTSTPLHLAHNSQHPQLKNTYPAPQQPRLFTPHHLYLTLLLQHLLHLKPPSLTHPQRKPLLPPTSPPTPYPPSPCQIPSPHSPQTATFTSYSALTSPLDSAPFI